MLLGIELPCQQECSPVISSEAECETVLERVCEAAVEEGAAPGCREVPRQVCRSRPAQRQQCKYEVGQFYQLK